MKKTINSLPLLCLLFTSSIMVRSQNVDTIKLKNKVLFDITLTDFPHALYSSNLQQTNIANLNKPSGNYNFLGSYKIPSMEQSTQVEVNTRQLIFLGTHKLLNRKPTERIYKKVTRYASELTLNLLADALLPFGMGWQHEEFHRATMSRCHCYSNNSLNNWITGKNSANSSTLKSVDQVLDTNLVLIKVKSNADLVRISAAGNEGNIFSAETMQRYDFISENGLVNIPYYLIRFLNVSGYLDLCSKKDQATNATLEVMALEKDNQSIRDFTGLDMTAWAYDLFNPNEPYSARGLNVYGNGYDRYIYGNKLTDEQYDWIKKQTVLSYINLISPLNYGFKSILLGKINEKKIKGNFAFRYYPTSFGNQLGLSIYLKYSKYNIVLSPLLNQNFKHSFPALAMELIDYPLLKHINASINASAWLQPKNQEFYSNRVQFGGLVNLRLDYTVSKKCATYIAFSCKSNGWVAGNPFLNSSTGIKFGFRFSFNQEY